MTETTTGGRGLTIALWAAQILLAAAFGFFGAMKASQPLAELAKMMTWVTTSSPVFVRGLGLAEVAGAIGLILPSLTRIQPKLTVAAALCFVVLQVIAIVFHATRGETAQSIGLNLVLLALSAFVVWGRSGKAAITPRG